MMMPLKSITLCFLFCVGSTESKAQKADHSMDFDRYHLVAERSARQTVITGAFLDNSIDDLVIVDDSEEKIAISFYSLQDSTWSLQVSEELDPGVLFVDSIEISGHDRIVLYREGRLTSFDTDKGEESQLLETKASHFTLQKTGIPNQDISHDVNEDGLEDIVVPVDGGFNLFVQKAGEFTEPLFLESRRIDSPNGNNLRYDPWNSSTTHRTDFNNDGKIDLVNWSDGFLEIYFQQENGLFAEKSRHSITDLDIDSDESAFFESNDLKGRVLTNIQDLNSDGICDLTVLDIGSHGWSKRRSQLEIYLGKLDDTGRTIIPESPDDIVISRGRIQTSLALLDLDDDGDLDLIADSIDDRYFRGHLWNRFKGSMGGEVPRYIEAYQMDDSKYSEAANFTRKVNLQYPGSHQSPGWIPLGIALSRNEQKMAELEYARAFKQPMLVGDFTGDGLADLAIGFDRRSIKGIEFHPKDLIMVYVGTRGNYVFTQEPEIIEVPMPDDIGQMWMTDMNRDGKQDIIIQYLDCCRGDFHREARSEPHKVITLLSK